MHGYLYKQLPDLSRIFQDYWEILLVDAHADCAYTQGHMAFSKNGVPFSWLVSLLTMGFSINGVPP